jgi:hypothetical protein
MKRIENILRLLASVVGRRRRRPRVLAVGGGKPDPGRFRGRLGAKRRRSTLGRAFG